MKFLIHIMILRPLDLFYLLLVGSSIHCLRTLNERFRLKPMEEIHMSNITLRIVDTTGHTQMENLSGSEVLEQVSAVKGDNWVFVDGLLIDRNELANTNIADNAMVTVTPMVIAGSV